MRDEDAFDPERFRLTPEQQAELGAAKSKAKPKRRGGPRPDRDDRLIGCPVWWLRCVRPVVKSRDQLIVAIYLWRRRIVCGCETFDVPNGDLRAVGVSRKAKHATLGWLAAAGLISVVRRSAKAASAVTILAKKPER
jgi:hypothetical protein